MIRALRLDPWAKLNSIAEAGCEHFRLPAGQ
jgi:hypothetical protein